MKSVHTLPLFPFVLAASCLLVAPPAPAATQETERPDLLTFARGTVFERQTGLATGSAALVLRMVDGDPRQLALSSDARGPVELVYKLPANTTFDRLAIPNVHDAPGNVTFFRDVVVSGSLEPESGFEVLAQATLQEHGPDQEVTELELLASTPVRYVKIQLSGGIHIEPDDVGKTSLRFSELVGNGSQESQELSSAFSGRWDFKLTERLDGRGVPMVLTQEGATIRGCLGHVSLTGSVNGRIARATGADVRNDRPSALILVADDDDRIQAVWSQNRGVFGARTAVANPDMEDPPCFAEAPPEPTVCGISVYVNFAYDSAEILPESQQVLADLYEGLVAAAARNVSIEGHTSTEGDAEYNQTLSERRARAIVDDLVSRGFPASALSAVGRGETAPLMRPDADESSRALNRRVEVRCG